VVRETFEGDEKPGRPPENDFSGTVLRFLERQHRSFSRQISKALYSPWTTILRVSDNLKLRFFARRWISQRLFGEQKAETVELSQYMLDMMQRLGPKQQKYLMIREESKIYWDNQHCGMGHRREMSPR
jgi:hypothetical protein